MVAIPSANAAGASVLRDVRSGRIRGILLRGESLGALYRLKSGEKVEIMGGMLVGRIWVRNASNQKDVDDTPH